MNKADVNAWVRYHSEISFRLTAQRTALESALIPVSAYILIACVECYRRYPALIGDIASAMPPEQIGTTGRDLGNEIDLVRLWGVANFPLVGRKILQAAGMVDPDDDAARLSTNFEFWNRAATSYHGNGNVQAHDNGGIVTPFADHVDEIMSYCIPVRDDERATVSRLNALLTSYLFLMWFDTRSGYQDSGPYELPDGKFLLLRAMHKLGPSDFPWSGDVARDIPYGDMLAAFVLDGASFSVTDFGTSLTDPDDYLPHVSHFALFDTTGAMLRPVERSEFDDLRATVKATQKDLYRRIAAMEHREKIDAGAYVYFSFLRPFAVAAGNADALDWTVPRDSLDLYPFLELVKGDEAGTASQETPETYYLQIP
ncbi:MAG: hypothetical protein JWL83_4032 [Actinomycetia bacterium]|nr:hypothetical protein [Actinomycetes bacterium]